jgi:hypothetical protein
MVYFISVCKKKCYAVVDFNKIFNFTYCICKKIINLVEEDWYVKVYWGTQSDDNIIT